MTDKMKDLFDYQKFRGHSRLAGLIAETERKYGLDVQALDDTDLEFLAAAGEAEDWGMKQDAEITKV